MDTIRLGRTNLIVSKNGFGALPVQRVGMEDACHLLRKAYENGINYFDTARAYSDSEEKIGTALSNVREKIIISTKTGASTVEEFWNHLNQSLSLLKTDYIDYYLMHMLADVDTWQRLVDMGILGWLEEKKEKEKIIKDSLKH